VNVYSSKEEDDGDDFDWKLMEVPKQTSTFC
jgi:hypothetical protein